MRNRKKRAQREEVRKILHEVRLQLAAQRMAQEKSSGPSTVLKLNELFNHARKIAT